MLPDPPNKRAVVVMTNSEWGTPAVIAGAVLDAMGKK
jgi:hypothetical protein